MLGSLGVKQVVPAGHKLVGVNRHLNAASYGSASVALCLAEVRGSYVDTGIEADI